MKRVILSLACMLPLNASAASGLMSIRAVRVPEIVEDYLSDDVAVLGLGPNAKVCLSQGRFGRIVDSLVDDKNPVALAAAMAEFEISLTGYPNERIEVVDYAGMLGIALTLAVRNVNTAVILRNYRQQDYRRDSYTVKLKVPAVPNCH